MRFTKPESGKGSNDRTTDFPRFRKNLEKALNNSKKTDNQNEKNEVKICQIQK